MSKEAALNHLLNEHGAARQSSLRVALERCNIAFLDKWHRDEHRLWEYHKDTALSEDLLVDYYHNHPGMNLEE